MFYAFIVSVDIFIIHTISVTSVSLRQERHALAALAAMKERENIQLLENDAYQKEMSLELAHRMKNQLALVQAIVAQTLRASSDICSLSATLFGRIEVLAKAHDMLVHGAAGQAFVADIACTVNAGRSWKCNEELTTPSNRTQYRAARRKVLDLA